MGNAKKVANPVSWKPSIEIFEAMQKWLEQNPSLDKSNLIDMAVAKFIQEQHILEPVEIDVASHNEVMKVTKKAMKKHKKALDRMK